MKWLLVLPIIVALCYARLKGAMDLHFQWKTLDWQWTAEQKDAAIKAGQYKPTSLCPMGIGIWKEKLFIATPRFKRGVPAGLSYVHLNSSDSAPKLNPYPSWEKNAIGDTKDIADDVILSTFRIKIDACDRLWFVDIGAIYLMDELTMVRKPTLMIYDLKTDKLIRSFELNESVLVSTSFIGNIDVDCDTNSCDKAHAVLADALGYAIIVYSYEKNAAWRFSNNYNYLEPIGGDLDYHGYKFQFHDGTFGLAFTEPKSDGYRRLIFHSLTSTKEFSVSMKTLTNSSLSKDDNAYKLFKFEGDHGPKSQSSGSAYDNETKVLFLAEYYKDAVACWKTSKALNYRTAPLVFQNHEELFYSTDLRIDTDTRILYVISNKFPKFQHAILDTNEVNFRVFQQSVDKLLKGSDCSK